MPGIGKQKIMIGYQVLPIKKTSTPRDIGDPAKARIDTLKWLKGEAPKPEHCVLLSPDDDEVLDRFREDLWVHPDRATGLGTPGVQFLLEAEAAQKDLLKSGNARLKADAEVLVNKVSLSEDLERNRLARLNQGNAEKRAIERERQLHITERVSKYKPVKESQLTINGIVKILCKTSTQRHPTVENGYVFPHTDEKMENENVGERTIGPRGLNDYVSRELVAIELNALRPALPREQQTPDHITNRLCKGGDRWTYNGRQSVSRKPLNVHVKKLLRFESMGC